MKSVFTRAVGNSFVFICVIDRCCVSFCAVQKYALIHHW